MMDGGTSPPQALSPQAPAVIEPGVGAHLHDEATARLAAWPLRLTTPLCLALLSLLSLAFFWRVVLLHQVLLPADVLYAKDPLWRTLAPHAFAAPANPLDSDALTEFYPWTALSMQALHHGTIPLWNPYAFAGTPFLAAMQTAVYYPINLLLEWLAPTPAAVLGPRAVMHLAIILIGAYLFARRLRLSHAAALLGAVAFGLGLPYMVWLEHPMAGAVAWLPWILLCTEGALTTRASARWLAALAAALALEALAGHGESSAHIVLLWSSYTLMRLGQIWRGQGTREAARVVAALAVAACIGFGLAAVHLAPSLAQIPLSEAAADRGASPVVGPLGDPALWHTLVVALVPDFFGNPTWHVNLLPRGVGYNEIALYVGAVPLALALLALLRRRGVMVLYFAITAVVALGMALRLPLFSLLDNLPGLRVAANGRLRIEYAFAVAMLAGYGLDALCDAAAVRTAWRLARGWWLVTALAALAGVALLLHARTVPPSTALLAALPAAWLALFAALLWLRRRGVLPVVALRWGAVGLAAAELFALGVNYHATTPATMLAAPPAVRAVQRDHSLYRVVGLSGALLPSLSSLYGLQDVRGYDPAYDATYERYFAASFGAGGMRLGLGEFGPSPAAARALDLMNVKYLFAACSVTLNPRYYRPIYHGAGCVYQNMTAMPRAVLVHAVQWAAPHRAAALLGSGVIDPRRTVLLDPDTAPSEVALADTRSRGSTVGVVAPVSVVSSETTVRGMVLVGATSSGAAGRVSPGAANRPASSVASTTSSGRAGDESVRVTQYALNTVILRVVARRQGVVVLADADAPGWRADVDGRATPIMRADAVFRAVAVGPGTHTIRFSYEPPGFRLGLAVSAATAALWLLLLLAALHRPIRQLRARRSPQCTVEP